MKQTWKQRLTAARAMRGLNKTAFSKAVGVSPPTVTDWEKSVEDGGIVEMKGNNLTAVCTALGISATWLLHGTEPDSSSRLDPHIDTSSREKKSGDTKRETDGKIGRIKYLESKGSCGGSNSTRAQIPTGHLLIESSFFSKYGVTPANTFAIYADGNSMTDFIVDGDIVIFDKTRTEPRSGKIFLIEHPEGLRIKQLRRTVDGAWVLENRNADKRTFPDERIGPGELGLLKIRGQFVFRQGGK